MRQLPQNTESICPLCHRRLPAVRKQVNGQVRLERECPEHGFFSTLIAESAAAYLAWQTSELLTRPLQAETETQNGCPHDCGLCPEHLQQACCVVVEVTSRCDQGCAYCFADSVSSPIQNSNQDLSLAELEQLLQSLLNKTEDRPFNIQFSGGEPTLRDDLPELVARTQEMGFPYIQLNTNGQRLSEDIDYCRRLAAAGLSSVFLQFDGTEAAIYSKLRGRATLDSKLQAIENMKTVGLSIVLAVTVVPGVNDDQIGKLIDFAAAGLPWIRGLHFQPVTYLGRYPTEPADVDRLSIFKLMSLIEEQTNGRMRREHFLPLATGSPYCSFHGRFIYEIDGTVRAISQASGPACCEKAAIVKARDFIGKQWQRSRRPDNQTDAFDDSFDGWLNKLEQRTLSLTAMGFQDSWTLDLERLKRCRVHVATSDGKLIPFCSYYCLRQQAGG
ncbi:MAG TPA: radical SAM protein [Clostridiales bacterium]|nr:radical SAM protein [Clostridiales bacterium]